MRARSRWPDGALAGRGTHLESTGALIAVAIAAMGVALAVVAGPLAVPAAVLAGLVVYLVLERPAAGVALALVLAPLTNAVVGGARPLRVVLPALALALLVHGLLMTRDRAPERDGRFVTLALLFYVAVTLASALLALDPTVAAPKAFARLHAVVLFFAVLQICRTRRDVVIVLCGLLAGVAVSGAQGGIQELQGIYSTVAFEANGERVERVQGAFGHPNQYAGFLAVLVPLAAAVLLTRRVPGAARAVAGLALLLAGTGLVLSYTRGALIGVLTGSLVWFAFTRPKLALQVCAAAAIFALVLAPPALQARLSTASGSDIALRTDLWATAVTMAGERPLLGVGTDNYGVAYERLEATPPGTTQRRLLHNEQLLVPPHSNNIGLNALAEDGVLGLAALVGLGLCAFGVALRASRLGDPLARSIGIGLGAGTATLAVHGMLEVTLLSELSQDLFALLALALVATRLAVRDAA